MAPTKSGLKRARATKCTKRKPTTDQLNQNVESLDDTAECDIPPPKKKGRGPGIIRDSTEDIEKRPEIWPVGKHEFMCHSKPRQIISAITRLALNYMPAPLRSYHAFDDHTKKNVEKAFLVPFNNQLFVYYNINFSILYLSTVISLALICSSVGSYLKNL